MHALVRTRTLAALAALSMATLATPSLTTAANADSSAKPGPVGGKVLLQAHTSLSGADAATDAAGNTYIGWIGDTGTNGNANRTIYLCTIPAGGSDCSGGVQSTPSLGVASAAGLRLLATKAGLVTLVWSADVAVPAFAGRDERIVTSTSQAGAPLTPATIVADAPSESSLHDAELAPDGSIWTVMAIGAGTNNMEIREGVQNPPVVVATPYAPGPAYLAFAGSTPVIAIQKYGAIITAPEYTHGVGAGFAPWAALGKTWTAAANIGLVATTTGVRIIDSVGNADYWPVVAKYSASSGTFGAAGLTGDKNSCAPSTHDLNADASGRLVDVNTECGNLAVASMPGTTVAGLFRMPVSGTFAGITPQIATTPRGHALLDDWMARRTGRAMDEGGRVASEGVVDEALLAALLADPFFARPAPKSLDRQHFAASLGRIDHLTTENGAATLASFTARAVALCPLPAPPLRVLATGGGRHNHAIMQALRAATAAPVDPVEAVGWDGDALEAQCFAYLAARVVRGLPLSFPTTTGVPSPQTGGRLIKAR